MPEVQTTDKAQENKGSENLKTTYTFEEMRDALENDPVLRDEFIKNEDKFIKVSDGDSEVTDKKDQKEIPDEKKEDESISVKVNKDWLSTYAKNRKPEEAIEEMAKGNKEKDKTITFFKEEKVPELEKKLEKEIEEKASLKRQIEEFEKKLEKDGKKPKEKHEEVIMPDLPEEDMFYTESGQKKIKEFLVASKKQNETLREELESLKEKVGKVDEKTSNIDNEKKIKDSIESEFKAIESFRKENDAIFRSTRPVKEIESEYVGYLDEIASVLGVETYEGSSVSKKVSDALNKILDESSEEGKDIKGKIKSKLPEEFDELSMIYSVRSIRNNTFEKNESGEFVPISYNQAFKIYQGQDGKQIKQAILNAKKKGHEKLQTAIEEKERTFAKETPPDEGQGPINADNYSVEEFTNLVIKGKSRTSEETEVLRTILKQKGVADEEIKAMLS